ncbi:MAG: hypothetical protein IKW08_00850 [Roseburia sp.]|nr:hypothetical protein [Roseburia sp.]
MSDVSALRARLSQEQARNSELRGCLAELGRGVSAAHREMSNYENKVQQTLNESNNRIRTSHENIIQAHEIQLEIDKLYVCFKNMELANKKIRACNNKKYYEFANYTTVRKIVQGMLDNLNLNMISDSIIYKAIEKEHLKTPDYWLTAVLLSIMAWKNDDKALGERATEIAINLDKKNSSIFYMLFNIRMGREEAALKWFMVYQECELKGSDQKTFLMLFSLLSKTLHDNVEDKIKFEVIDFINRVIAMNAQAEGFDEQTIVDNIEYYLKRMKGDDKLETKMLKRCIVDYSEMADIVVSAENNINILQFILDVSNVSELEKNAYLDQFINDEIAKPNNMEISVYDEIEYNELVIYCNGNMQKTEEIYSERQKKRKESLNLISEMIDWIYCKNAGEEVNGQVRKNMFTLTAELQRKAVDQYVEHYRNRKKDVHSAEIGDYSTEINFNDKAGEMRKVTNYYENDRDEKLSQIKYVISIIGGIVCALGIGLTVYTMNPACLMVSGAGIAMIVYNIISNNMQKKHIHETCQLNIKNKSEMIETLFAEYDVYKNTLMEYDSYYDKILSAFNQF